MIAPGTRVEVYYNLRKQCLSYRTPGGKVQHADCIELTNVTFTVQPAGRARVLREKRKNVHAFVRGDLVDVDHQTSLGWNAKPITYNPYKYETFVYQGNKQAVLSADHVLIEGPYVWEFPTP